MSFASTLRPTSLPFGAGSVAPATQSTGTLINVPFHHDPDYLALSRMLVRYQSSILLTTSPNSTAEAYDLTLPQRRVQAELWSPLPYHRTKWLHNIDGARNLLLRLERTALGIKVQRAKKEALKDLAEKRALIKRLRSRVEEIGREIEKLGDKAWNSTRAQDDELLGERVEDIVGKATRRDNMNARSSLTDRLEEGKPVLDVASLKSEEDEDVQREVLFGSSMRRRQGQTASDEPPSQSEGKSSGFSNLKSTERALADSSRTHEDLTTSLVSMAAQLKQQTRAFEFSLDQDKGLLDRALEGLDRNVSGMELASKNMAFLRRMSEGEGWWGRMKLYAFIFGMWVAAILLVFVGPKLRF